jgi:N-methylhydantoinase A
VALLAVDIGGTFTDLIAFDERSARFYQAKSLTTPSDPVEGIIDCIRKIDFDPRAIDALIHGSTTAINTLIERKGATVGLIVTRGTRDVYLIGRGNRPDSYNLFFHRPRPLVPRHLTVEADERLYASGEVREDLRAESVREACAAFARAGVDAVAVCFLHSYANPEHEREAGRIVEAALPLCYVSLSHEILREYREYERLSTTVVNAYIGPKVGGYVRNLQARLKGLGFRGELAIMQSNGGVMAPEAAIKRPVMMMESGPVGGIIASAEIGTALHYRNVISFDMGGTTAKAGLVEDGEVLRSEAIEVGGGVMVGSRLLVGAGYMLKLPAIDLAEVGAGGGSICRLDPAGAPKVGPDSAGADPGPVCYGRGGTAPTITDCNLVLGYLSPDNFLGGRMRLDAAKAHRAIEDKVARPLAMPVEEAAEGVVRIIDVKMEEAIKAISTMRGHDLRDFTLLAFGGAGPLHAARIARHLGLNGVVVPHYPGVFSAIGLLISDVKHDYVQSRVTLVSELTIEAVDAVFDRLEREARAQLRHDGFPAERIGLARSLDMRYAGEGYEIAVPCPALGAGGLDEVRRAFDALHKSMFGHSAPDEPVEVVSYRLRATGLVSAPQMPRFKPAGMPLADAMREHRKVWFDGAAIECPVYQRERIDVGFGVRGPAIIDQFDCTTLVCPGQIAQVDAWKNLVITEASP